MTDGKDVFEKKIIDVFIKRYSASARLGERNAMRLRSTSIFPEFDGASPDEKESYLEAAESLERKGILSINWEKRAKGNRIKTLVCGNFERLFRESGELYPKAEAEAIRVMLVDKIIALKKSLADMKRERANAEKALAFLAHFFDNFGSPKGGYGGINIGTVSDFVRLLECFFEPERLENITSRALSIALYRDSKHLERLMTFFGPALSLAEKQAVPVPDLTFLKRSFPETMIGGKLIFEYRNTKRPMINESGRIIGIPLESAEEIGCIKTITLKKPSKASLLTPPSVLTVENKETFHALANPRKPGETGRFTHYDCVLYTGGYPNRAVAALICLLADSGFCFHHAGDLDPDGILILQNIIDIAEKPVVPIRMDAPTFDRYLPWSRPLGKTSLSQIHRIREDTKAIPSLTTLIRRIEETGQGVEQEIIDYRE